MSSSGKQVWYSAKLSRHSDGTRIVIVIRDVTDLKNALDEARASHGVALLYQDITGHDVRNSLQAILIASDLLYEDEEDESKQSLISHINESVLECSDLIAAVQATADLLTAPLEKTSLDFTLKGCLKMFTDEYEDIQLQSDIGTSNAIVQADRFLCHMIMNVLSNAAKHNESESKQVWTSLSEDSQGFTVTIADNGPGIRDDLKRNLMNPNRRAGGVGIHQCMQIASKYGGRFDIVDRVEGDFSQGTKVVIWLPKGGTISS